MKKAVTEEDENGLLTRKWVDHDVTISIDIPKLMYWIVVVVAIAVAWWFAHNEQGNVAVLLLGGCLVATTYHYMQVLRS